ncbi:MAG: alpha/beta hydrolase [Magnetococcales bacterium]|nr:alpha/beta hydrolase [Magnetococcales bacterium]
MTMTVVGSTLVLWYLLMTLLLYLSQNQQVFHPTRVREGHPAGWGLIHEPVMLDSAGIPIRAWWLPGAPERPVVLFFHGNACNISQLEGQARLFHAMGWSSLLVDYRGYGESGGEASEAGTYEDALSAWNHLTGTRTIDPGRIILYGHSLGGGVAVWLAGRTTPRGVILEGTFTSIADRAAELYPWLPVRWLARIHYDNVAGLARVQAPLLIIHSREDRVVPFHHGQRLFDAAGGRKWFLPILGDHNSALVDLGEAAREVLVRFERDSRPDS